MPLGTKEEPCAARVRSRESSVVVNGHAGGCDLDLLLGLVVLQNGEERRAVELALFR